MQSHLSACPRSQVHSSMSRTKEKNNLSNLYKPHEQSYLMRSETQMNEWLAPGTLQCPSAVRHWNCSKTSYYCWNLEPFILNNDGFLYVLNLASQSGSPLMLVNIVSDCSFFPFWPVNNHKKHNGTALDPELILRLQFISANCKIKVE